MAKPKLALIPAAQGDKFYSVLPSDGVGDFDFTRNSSATRIAPTGFIQEVGAFGSELVTNGDFATDSDWSKGAGWSISGGKANYNGSSNNGLIQYGIFNTGLVYRLTFDLVSNGAEFKFWVNGTQNIFSSNLSTGSYTYDIVATTSGSAYFESTSSFSGSIDNVSIVRVLGNQSRLNYDLLNGKVVNCPHYLLEPASTNIFSYSEGFTNSYWSTSRIETPYVADVISPDGALNAYTLEMSSGETNGGGVFKTGISITGDNSFSVFAKKKTANYLVISDTGTTTNAVYFDLENGAVGTTYNATGEMQDFGNGWYRCTMKYTLTSSGAKFIYFSNIDGATSGGVSGGDAIYIFGAQLEESSYPTSYIPTNGTSITRAVESATGSGNAATFNDSEGVLMVEATIKQITSTNSISLTDGTANNLISIFANTSSTNSILFYLSFNGTVIVSSEAISINNIDEYNKISVKYKSGLTKIYINGFLRLSKSNSFSGASFDRLHFAQFNESPKFIGNTRELQYFDSVLTDAQLETLTSWTSLQEMITSQLYTNY